MKKSLIAGLLGFASAVSIMAQGHILFSNYEIEPYNQIVWGLPNPGFIPLNDPLAQVQFWFGKGVLTDETLLMPGVTTSLGYAVAHDPGAGYGPGGYINPVIQPLLNWNPGDTFTFQIRVTYDFSGGLFIARSPLWTERDAIKSIAGPAPLASTFPALVISIPEPTTAAFLVLAGGMLFWRRILR